MRILASFFSCARFTLVAALLPLLCCCARGSGLPSELDHIPQNLKNEKLEVQGIYPARTVNWHSAPISRATGERRLGITFNETQMLPGGDGRLVGARLEYIGFVETSGASDIVYSPKLQLGDAWGVLESFHSERFRWVENDAELLIETPQPRSVVLSLSVEPGPGIGAKSFELKLLDATGNAVGTQRVDGRRSVYFTLPALSGTQYRFRLHTDGGGKRSATDTRILNFRVFKIELR